MDILIIPVRRSQQHKRPFKNRENTVLPASSQKIHMINRLRHHAMIRKQLCTHDRSGSFRKPAAGQLLLYECGVFLRLLLPAMPQTQANQPDTQASCTLLRTSVRTPAVFPVIWRGFLTKPFQQKGKDLLRLCRHCSRNRRLLCFFIYKWHIHPVGPGRGSYPVNRLLQSLFSCFSVFSFQSRKRQRILRQL